MKDFKIYVDGRSEEVQKKIFELGGHWNGFDRCVRYTQTPFLYVTGKRITLGVDMIDFKKHYSPEIKVDELLAMKKEVEFKPFDMVLARDGDGEYWTCEIFSHHMGGKYQYMCIGSCYNHCIPYKGNEDLLGTTNNP